MKQITIGIPRALLYYKYHVLWETFFRELGVKTITSSNTTKETLENGRNYLIDEACLSMKIYAGHIKELVGKCDYILVPRIICLKKKELLCTNFSALYDLIHNVFSTKILHYNIDVTKGETEYFAFLKMGKELGFSLKDSIHAYQKAKKKEEEKKLDAIDHQILLLRQDNIKIMIAGHPYNIYDKLIGGMISDYLKKEKVQVLYSDKYNTKFLKEDCKHISKDLYWTYNKEILASIWHYHKKIDGLILLTTFPCGPDSLTNEMILRKMKNIPITNIIVDELNSEAGLITRLESFLDIIKERKRYNEKARNC